MAAALAALSFTAVGLMAAEPGVEDKLNRFQLFNNCRPMVSFVEDLPGDAAKIGLTRDTLNAAIESRLRAARLFGSDSDPYLYLNVNVTGQTFNILLQFKKLVMDRATHESFHATTWQRGFTGAHGGGSAYMLGVVAEFMDEFILEYLRVNHQACSASPLGEELTQ